MADNLDDGEFWLPPQFLTDDDDDTSFDGTINNNNFFTGIRNDDVFDAVSRSLIPYLSSCSETESDEDEAIAELTRELAQSTLELYPNKPKDVFEGGSPQSTLSALGSSGKGSSPNGAVSQANLQTATFDLLRAAAGEVERIRLDENRYGYGSVRNNNNEPKPSPVNVNAPVNSAVGSRFYSQQQQQQQQQQPSLSQQQLQITQFEVMRQQQMAKQQQQRPVVPNRGRNNINNNNNVRGLSGSAWPPLQQGSRMRAVFLAGKRESAGTGVFLPRSVETRNESRKKPVCKTALVPDRVVQALNLNLETAVGAGHLQQHQPQQRRFNGGNGSAVSRVRGNNNNYYGLTLQKRNNLNPQAQVVNHEIQLPQEWTY